MSNVILVGRLDVAELVFYAFVLFFIGLVYYLRREDRREGYPVEDEITGRVDSAYGLLTASTYKEFPLPFGRGVATNPTKGREPVEIAARRVDRFGGAPYEPTGDPLVDGIGPAAFAQRAPWPDLDSEGRPRIVPLSVDDHFGIAHGDPDPRGMAVLAADGVVAGRVVDVWIDRSDRMIRYYEVETPSGRRVLAPFPMTKLDRRRGRLVIDAISAAQYENAPTLATPGEITRYEEERVMAYFGGGYLYGLPGRTEPLL
jgi:photosynthetic reaction center H subunit